MCVLACRTPESHEELVEYFLNTVAEDMEFEVSRYRPRLTAEFFRCVRVSVGTIVCCAWSKFGWGVCDKRKGKGRMEQS